VYQISLSIARERHLPFSRYKTTRHPCQTIVDLIPAGLRERRDRRLTLKEE